jgi:hypothetical protein
MNITPSTTSSLNFKSINFKLPWKFMIRRLSTILQPLSRKGSLTMSRFLGMQEEVPTGPTVNSDIAEERIQARRERIAVRALAESR